VFKIKESDCKYIFFCLIQKYFCLLRTLFIRSTNSTSAINGTASASSATEPNKLIVKFPINVFGYNIFNTNGKYDIWSVDYGKAALVYSCSSFIPGFLYSESAWILGRSKTLDNATISSLKSILSTRGINVGQFEKVKQVCNN
jgi:lipocalin